MRRKTKVYLIHVVGFVIASLAIGGAKFFNETEAFLTRPAGFWAFLILGLFFLSGFFWLNDENGIGGNTDWDDSDYDEQEYHHSGDY
jgi:hypothetical protein